MARWKVAPDEATRLARLDGAAELPLQLPQLLARDLNACMYGGDRPAPRVVLLFDTHEAFWGEADSAGAEHAPNLKDEWLRRLLRALRSERVE